MAELIMLLSLPIILIAWYIFSLLRNYQRARRIGLPILICPVSPVNPLWLVFAPILEPTLVKYLPSSLYERIKVSIHGWEFRSKYEVHAKLGPVFCLVTPGTNEIWIADPDCANEVLMRRNDFVQLEISRRVLGLFGQNILSTDGQQWQRHRRIVAPTLNERIMGKVWAKSSVQAEEMATSFTKRSGHQVVEGLLNIAINVLGSTAYGDNRSWKESMEGEAPPEHYRMTFMQALLVIVKYFFFAVFLSTRFLSLPIMPKMLRQTGIAAEEFPKYVKELLEKEQQNTSQEQNTLLSVLVRNAEKEKHIIQEKSKTSTYLTEAEITGNLFGVTVAGFDTIAGAMAYAIITLAIEPQWQDWIIQEIDEVNRLHPNADYDSIFPSMTRCLAVLYETLRLYPPLIHITRGTTTTQKIGLFTIPPDTNVFVNVCAMHTSPSIYENPLSFRPTRWLKCASDREKTVTLLDPSKGTFLAWSGGPRICPGMKMAQVEFVAVLRSMFQNCRIEAVREAKETESEARQRLRDVLRDSQPKITLQIKRPQDVTLRWTNR